MTLCAATFRVSNPAALTAALDEAYDRVEDDPDGTACWSEPVVTRGTQYNRAHLRLTGEDLRIEANSDIRFDRVVATLTTLDPTLSILRQSREPLDAAALRRRAACARRPLPPSVDPAGNPDIAAAVNALILNYETSWLVEPIPALAGRTPRECADDPTRCPDLVRLLDSFPPDTGQPGQMSAARLRTALGLD